MKNFLLIDATQRKVNSILFRATIILYSLFLMSIEINFFNIWVYVVGLFTYTIFYFLCFRRSYIRLLNDFVIMILITWHRNPENIYVFIYLILPIINSINFSGTKQKPLFLYCLTIATYAILYYVFNNDFNLNCLLISAPLLFLYFINRYTHLRVKVSMYKEELIEVVDIFYIQKKNLQRPYKVFAQLIKAINKIFKDRIVENIYCFTVTNNKIHLLNGTKFIWHFDFFSENILIDLRKDKYLLNEQVNIENRDINLNLIMYSVVDGHEYIYLFTLNRNFPFYYMLIDFFSTLQPALNKISKILLSEKEVQLIRLEEIQTLSEKRQYVTRANNMMHFIRNRLSPFSNLIKMHEISPTVHADILNDFNKKLHEQNERAKIELKNITDRADDMLEKSKNPFFYSMLQKVSIIRTYTLLKRNFNNIFPEEELIADINPNRNKWLVEINQEGYEILISDWLNNIKKYYNKHIKCIFTEDGEYLYITFENDHSQSKEEISNLINDLTSDDRNEIMKRTTYGLYTIKTLISDMKININVFEEKGILKFTLKLKISNDENSNI